MINNGTIYREIRPSGYPSDYVITSYIGLHMDWEATSDILANKTTLKLTMRYSGNFSWGASESNPRDEYYVGGEYVVNGVKVGMVGRWIQYNQTNVVLPSYTVEINHNDDGSANIQVGFNPTGNIITIGSWSRYYESDGRWVQQTGTLIMGRSTREFEQGIDLSLPVIPRATEIISFPNFIIGTNFNISLNRKSTDYTNTLILKSGNTTIKTITGVAASATISLTQAEQDALIATIPNSTAGTVTLQCTTYKGPTQIGQPVSKTTTATIPPTIIPTFTSITATETISNVNTIVGAFTQNLSNLKLKINGAAGTKGSTISSYSIELNGARYITPEALTGFLNWNGTKTVTATVTDSRGRTATKTLNITVLPYLKPVISTFKTERANSNGSLSQMGTYAKISRIGSVSSLNNKNNYTFKIYSRAKGSSSWGTVKAEGTSNTGEINMNYTNVLSSYLVTASYEFRIELTDKFNTSVAETTLGTGQVVMSWGKTGVGIGKIWQQGALDIDGDVYISGRIWGTTKHIDLTGKIQVTSYRRSVIALCNLTNTNTSADSYSIGTLSFHRTNGLSAPAALYFGIEKKYNTAQPNYFGFGFYNNFGGTAIRPCTFTYNGIKYGGIELFFTAAELSCVEFFGNTNFNIFGVDYYNTQTSTAINNEINNSLNFNEVIITHSAPTFNGNNICHTGNKNTNEFRPEKLKTFATRPSSANQPVTEDKNGTIDYMLATSSMTTGKPNIGDSHLLTFNWDNIGGWNGQIALRSGNANELAIRVMNGGSWLPWMRVTHQYGTGNPPTLAAGEFYWQHE